MAEKKKIIDEKGKLFGKISIIDLLVLVLILAVVTIVGLKFLGKDQTIPGGVSASTELEYTVLVSRVNSEVYDTIVTQVAEGGDNIVLMANGERLAGSSVLAVTAKPHQEAVPCADGSIVLSEEPGVTDVIFTIRATVSNPVTQAVGTQEVRVGKSHIVKTVTFELSNGIILTCEPVQAAQ